MPSERCITNKDHLFSGTVPTPYGPFLLTASPKGLVSLKFPRPSKVKSPRGKASFRGTNPKALEIFRQGKKALVAYFRGQQMDLRGVSVDLRGYTAFEKKVLKTLRQVAPGVTLSYGELALKSGYPRAARAVGWLMSKNRLPIVIPCHRVTASGRTLGGYSQGRRWKRRLLDLEQARRSVP